MNSFSFTHLITCLACLLAIDREPYWPASLTTLIHLLCLHPFLFLEPSTLSIQQTSITYILKSLCCFSLITQKGWWLGPLLKLPPTSSTVTKRPLSSARCKIPHQITANKFQGYKETPVFSEMQNTPIKRRRIDPHIAIMVKMPKPI